MPKLIVSLIALAVSIAAAGQSPRGITGPRMINPPGSPLLITSVTMDLTDALKTVTLKNVSGNTITSFQLGVIMAIPSACGPKEAFSPERVMQADRVSIQPGATAQTNDYRFSFSEISSFAAASKASDVQTQVAVVHVSFADGTEWNLPSHTGTYDNSVMASIAKLHCGQSEPLK